MEAEHRPLEKDFPENYDEEVNSVNSKVETTLVQEIMFHPLGLVILWSSYVGSKLYIYRSMHSPDWQ